jgi:hypothetical protein
MVTKAWNFNANLFGGLKDGRPGGYLYVLIVDFKFGHEDFLANDCARVHREIYLKKQKNTVIRRFSVVKRNPCHSG